MAWKYFEIYQVRVINGSLINIYIKKFINFKTADEWCKEHSRKGEYIFIIKGDF